MVSELRWTEIINKNIMVNYFVSKLLNTSLLLFRKIQTRYFNSTENVVIISLHKLGDSVFTIPAVKYLVEKYEQNIYLVCFKETVPIYEYGLNNVNIVTIDNKSLKINGRWADKKTRSLVKNIKPNIIFDLNGDMLSLSLMLFSKAKDIYGLSRPHFSGFYTNSVEVRKIPNVIQIYTDAIKTRFEFDLKEVPDIFPANLKSNGSVIIHPFAGWDSKEWGINKFIRLAGKICTEFNVKMISQSGTLEQDTKLELAEHNIEYIETSTIDELIEHIKDASLFIGNDSGPTYIANLLGVPTFTIFGPSNPIFHVLPGNQNEFIQLRLKCSPQANEKVCFTNGGRNGCPSYECMNILSVEYVYQNLNSFMNKIFK